MVCGCKVLPKSPGIAYDSMSLFMFRPMVFGIAFYWGALVVRVQKLFLLQDAIKDKTRKSTHTNNNNNTQNKTQTHMHVNCMKTNKTFEQVTTKNHSHETFKTSNTRDFYIFPLALSFGFIFGEHKQLYPLTSGTTILTTCGTTTRTRTTCTRTTVHLDFFFFRLLILLAAVVFFGCRLRRCARCSSTGCSSHRCICV